MIKPGNEELAHAARGASDTGDVVGGSTITM